MRCISPPGFSAGAGRDVNSDCETSASDGCNRRTTICWCCVTNRDDRKRIHSAPVTLSTKRALFPWKRRDGRDAGLAGEVSLPRDHDDCVRESVAIPADLSGEPRCSIRLQRVGWMSRFLWVAFTNIYAQFRNTFTFINIMRLIHSEDVEKLGV